jgi:hypothetical protein
MVEGSVDVFHQRDTLLGKVRDELLKYAVVEVGTGKGDDVGVESELPC